MMKWSLNILFFIDRHKNDLFAVLIIIDVIIKCLCICKLNLFLFGFIVKLGSVNNNKIMNISSAKRMKPIRRR